jgi:predicted O-methyltransferase YrrM
MRDLAIIVPTRGRPDNVRKVISAWDFTGAWDHADLVLATDEDDPEYQGYLDLIGPDRTLDMISGPVWVPMVHKLDMAARMMAGHYFALGFAGDDHLPQTIGWAKRYLTVLRELKTGMVYGDDGYQGAKLSTEWAVTSDVVRALGRMVPARVEHMFCDNAILELFTEAGAVRHLPEVRIEHMHPYAGKADTDDQYQRVNGRDQMNRDRRTYQSWQRSELASQVAIVRSLRRGQPEERPRERQPVRTARRQGGKMTTRPPRFFRRVQAATPEDVMMALADLAVRVPADQEIVEIGVFHGRTALQLAWGARQGQGAHVTGIDLWDSPGNTYGPPFTDPSTKRWAHHHVQSLGYSRSITLVQGFSHEVAATWEGPPVGLLFVDGDHSKDGARRDIEAWIPYLAPDAKIAVDDYGHPDWPGVAEALDELVGEGVLEPVEVFHDALAVTRLADNQDGAAGRTLPRREDGTIGDPPIKAMTSEGVHPSPEPEAQEWPTWPISDKAAADPDLQFPDDTEVSTEVDRTVVAEGELEEVDAGTPITSLGTIRLRALAKVRGITLGKRADKRAEMLAALKAGE